jgi:iron complex outermembrane receptor protein
MTMAPRYLLTCALAALSVPGASLAQQSQGNASAADPAQQNQPSDTLGDIVVSAQKGARGESLQRVPVAITAVTADTLSDIQARNVSDVGRLAPNVMLDGGPTYPNYANFYIRGVGVSQTVRSVDPAVNVVVDGMVYSYQVGTVLDSFDLESVEMLRGPQGVLFGRNATGGAVVLRSVRPTNELKVQGEVEVGNFQTYAASGLIAGPLVEDKILAKLALGYRRHDGYFKDRNGGTFVVAPANPSGLEPGTAQQDVMSDETFFARPTLVFKPTETMTFSVLGEYLRSTGSGNQSQAFIPADRGLTALVTSYGYTPPTDKFEVNVNFPGYHRTTAKRIIGELEWKLDAGVVTSITGYRHVKSELSLDQDGSPFVIQEFPDNYEGSDQFSQELRFASDFGGRINFVVGGYYDNVNRYSFEQRKSTGLLLRRDPLDIVYTRGYFEQAGESLAGFLNVDWRPVDKLRVAVGGRYSWERKNIDLTPLAICTGPGEYVGCSSTVVSRSKSWNDFTPRFVVDYQASRDALIYASYTKGFRSGNFNGRASSAAALGPTEPESVNTYEAGAKITFLGGRARLNIAGFHSQYDDIQRTIIVGVVQTLGNAGSARINGIEIEGNFRSGGLQLDASFGLTDAKYNSFRGLDLNGDGVSNAADDAIAVDLKFDRVPKYTAYASAAYTIDAGRLAITPRVSYSYRSSYFTDALNNSYGLQGAYGLLDAAVKVENGPWYANIFVRNITNELAFDFAATIGGPFVRYGGVPRTFGLAVGYRY